jgi:hypothetical protein
MAMAMVTALLCHKGSNHMMDANDLIAKYLLSVTYILIFQLCTFSTSQYKFSVQNKII